MISLILKHKQHYKYNNRELVFKVRYIFKGGKYWIVEKQILKFVGNITIKTTSFGKVNNKMELYCCTL